MFSGLKCADLLMRYVLKPTFVEVCDGIQTYRLSPEFLFRPAYSSQRSDGPPSPGGRVWWNLSASDEGVLSISTKQSCMHVYHIIFFTKKQG